MRIFLACADERLKLAMLMLLDNEPGMVVAGISDRLQGLPAQVEASQPDVLILERNEPLPQIMELITNIHNLAHPLVIVYLSSREQQQEPIMAAGADYFVLKNAPPDELLTILNNLRLPEAKKPDH
jgi:DNA-binding NarL/FixJ family response regulator